MDIHVRLESPVSTSFRCQKAADSLDIDASKKSVHDLLVKGVDLDAEYNVGLIVGASGSGKTTLAHKLWGADVFRDVLDLELPVIEQFPASMEYDDCVNLLNGVGLTAVPCWIRPAYTLSNGQRARAEIALRMADDDEQIVIDEWTSVVDRTVAKVMSHAIQKFARRTGKQVVLCSCHYDVVEWLNPDWIIDCNKQEFVDRRRLRRGFKREETLDFEVREASRRSWKNFSRYHYLSERLPGGHIETFGVFHEGTQMGFVCYANYVPHREGSVKKMHMNRLVIHPDYVGFGMGIQVVNVTSAEMVRRGYDVWSKFSSAPVHRAMQRYQDRWALREVRRQIKRLSAGGNMKRKQGFRQKVKVYSYQWIGGDDMAKAALPPQAM